jgi:hypothetical protein
MRIDRHPSTRVERMQFIADPLFTVTWFTKRAYQPIPNHRRPRPDRGESRRISMRAHRRPRALHKPIAPAA